jgi:hypothetical protein
MSTVPPSRAHLGDVIGLISKTDLPERRKQDLRSALRSVAKLLGATPTDIAADPALLRRRLEVIFPEAHGLSRGRWANIRSLVGKALALARPMSPSRSVHPLLPEWEKLAAGLEFNRRVRLLRCSGS